ncbi:MAG: WecB/TagA/CpsF family glycosyltransferase [Clostridiales bacterium]|nr:WecB/TagA/CpsF family glycosyltransferase [Clostridiales bacterium]
MKDKVNILGVWVDMVNIPRAVDKIMQFFNDDGLHKVYTPNSEIIMAAYKDDNFRDILNDAELLTADGIGVVYASKILGKPITERAAGYDILCEILERIKGTSRSVFLFGGKPGVAETAEEKLKERYPGIVIAGTRNGYFKPEEEEDIVSQINSSGAELLLVCLGAPKQELWINKYKDKLNVKVAMGVGGSLDVFAGTALRAPDFYCKHGLEWFYRLMKQPSRAGRMLALPKFGFTVLFKGRKYKQED